MCRPIVKSTTAAKFILSEFHVYDENYLYLFSNGDGFGGGFDNSVRTGDSGTKPQAKYPFLYKRCGNGNSERWINTTSGIHLNDDDKKCVL